MEHTAGEVWSRILDTAKAALPEQAFRTWLAPTEAVAISQDLLVVSTPNPFAVDWVEDKYAHATHATVAVRRENGHAVIDIRDDGVGGAAVGDGSGLRGLGDRVGALDGTLEVTSPPGAGTLVRARIPT